MKPYKKNFKPTCRQDVAGGNDGCWIPAMQKKMTRKEKETYDKNYVRIFGHE